MKDVKAHEGKHGFWSNTEMECLTLQPVMLLNQCVSIFVAKNLYKLGGFL